jgi:phosphatidylserine/phosphatidylglycerophosphate/cardiolipin synthase-like enzyme
MQAARCDSRYYAVNLNDFFVGVSDIVALQRLLRIGGRVRGIRNLHSKLYIFGPRRAILTSANLTAAALDMNHEFGMVIEDKRGIEICQRYFENFWTREI